MDANGNLTPEREQIHREIIDKLLEGKIPVEGQATMTMLGGGPASGKSSVMNSDTSNNPNAVTVDPDTIKRKQRKEQKRTRRSRTQSPRQRCVT